MSKLNLFSESSFLSILIGIFLIVLYKVYVLSKIMHDKERYKNTIFLDNI